MEFQVLRPQEVLPEGFRCIEFDVAVENKEKQAPEVKKEEQLKFEIVDLFDMFNNNRLFVSKG